MNKLLYFFVYFAIFVLNFEPILIAANVISRNIEEPDFSKADGVAHFSTSGIYVTDKYAPGHLTGNTDLCGPSNGANISLLIMITSAPKHRDQRMAIRETWGQIASRPDIAIAFVVAKTSDQTIVDSMKEESRMFHDMIFGDFEDRYDHLTLKSIAMLEFADTLCSEASFLFKTDDDMFINVELLLSYINQIQLDGEQKIIFGRLSKRGKPNRNTTSKYYASRENYFLSKYPYFVNGHGYGISRAAIHDLYTSALKQEYFQLEDVFIAGILAELLHIKRIHAYEDYNRNLNCNIAFDTKCDICKLREIFSVHGVPPRNQYDLWKKFKDEKIKCENIECPVTSQETSHCA